MSINNKVIKFWDEKGLSNIYSSTCNEDTIISFSKNETEKYFLKYFLIKYKSDNKFALDIGSGLGRFTIFLSKFFNYVVSLEPSEKLHKQLKNNLREYRNTFCINKDFYSFLANNKDKFDLILISGLFYLMNDHQVIDFLKKCKSILNINGIIVIRDFISRKTYETNSSYISGIKCCYRNIGWWNDRSKIIGMNILNIKKANIGYGYFKKLINYALKKKYLRKIYLILEFILRNGLINKLFFELCKISPLIFINKDKIKTIFLILKSNAV